MRIYRVILAATSSTGERGTFMQLARGDKELTRFKDEYGAELVSTRELNHGEGYSCDTCQESVVYPHRCLYPCW
jgi:hypothetical protein